MGIGSGPVIGVVFCNGVGILGTSAPTRTPNPDSSDGGFRYRRQLSSHIGPDYLSGTRRARAGLRAKHYHIMLTDKGLTFPASFSIVSSYNARQLSCHRLSGRWHPLTYAATPTYRLVCMYSDYGYKKPTRFWTNIKGFNPKKCKKNIR